MIEHPGKVVNPGKLAFVAQSRVTKLREWVDQVECVLAAFNLESLDELEEYLERLAAERKEAVKRAETAEAALLKAQTEYDEDSGAQWARADAAEAEAARQRTRAELAERERDEAIKRAGRADVAQLAVEAAIGELEETRFDPHGDLQEWSRTVEGRTHARVSSALGVLRAALDAAKKHETQAEPVITEDERLLLVRVVALAWGDSVSANWEAVAAVLEKLKRHTKPEPSEPERAGQSGSHRIVSALRAIEAWLREGGAL